MRRTRRPLAALALVAMLALLAMSIAGSSNAAARTGAGRGGGTTPTTYEQAMKFAECMRDNGVKDFPDPDASREFTIDGVINGSSLDPNTAAWKKATGACKNLQPPGYMGQKRSAQQQENALKFAQCMRDNGVKDFPDPANGEPLIDTTRIPSSATKGGMSMLNATLQKCRDDVVLAGGPGGKE